MDLVAIMVKGGVKYDDAVIIADLAYHAIDEAQKAMTRVADTAPDHLRVQVLMTATLLMSNAMDSTKEYLNTEFKVDLKKRNL